MFGAVGDGTTNDTAAIQAAVDYCSKTISKTKTVQLGKKTYLITAPINMTRGNLVAGSLSRGDIEIRGHGFNFDSIILGQTGNNKSVIDVSCTTNFRLTGFSIKASDTNPSGIGILALGGQELGNGFCGASNVNDVYILLKEDMTANSGLGTVGIYCGSCEEGQWDKIHIQANIPLFMTGNMTSTLCPGFPGKFISDYITTDNNFSCGVNIFNRCSFIGLGRERPLIFAQNVNVLHVKNFYFARLGTTTGTYSTSVVFGASNTNVEFTGGDESGCFPLINNMGVISGGKFNFRTASSSTLYSNTASDPILKSTAQQSNYGGAWLHCDVTLNVLAEIPTTAKLYSCTSSGSASEPIPAMLSDTNISISKEFYSYPNLIVDKNILIKSRNSNIKYNDIELNISGTKQQSVSVSNVPLTRAVASTTLSSVIAVVDMADLSSATNANAHSLNISVNGLISTTAFPFRSTAGQYIASAISIDEKICAGAQNTGTNPKIVPAQKTNFDTLFTGTAINVNSASMSLTSANATMTSIVPRANSFAYNLGDTIFVNISGKICTFTCTTAGTSASSQPAFNTGKGQTTTDGGAVWTTKRGEWKASTAYVASDTIAVLINGICYEMKVNVGGTSGTTEPTWAISTFDFVDGGTLRWLHGGARKPNWQIEIGINVVVGANATLYDVCFSGEVSLNAMGCRESSPMLFPAWSFLPSTLQNSI